MKNPLIFPGFELDIEAAEIRSAGNRVDVEPQVFDLIVLLAMNARRCVTKDEIIKKVWHGRIVSDSAISTRINAARRALGDDGTSQKVIKTIHGRGFRFEIDPLPDSAETPNETNDGAGQPVDVHYCTAADGVGLAYAEVGQGAPLVKAASFMTHLQHDSEGIVFKDWISVLAGSYRYVRYDERGNGLSDWNIENFSFEAMVEDLETVIDAIGLEKFVLLGVSQGASVSFEYARRHPERVAGLIIFGGYAAGWRRSSDEPNRARRDALMDLARITWGDDNPAGRQAYANLFLPDGTPEQQVEFAKLQQITTTPENAYRILKTFSDIDVRAILPEIKAPALVMHCNGDAVVPFDEGKAIAAGLPDARFVMLEGRNHIIQSVDPGWPRFIAEIERFMAANMKA